MSLTCLAHLHIEYHMPGVWQSGSKASIVAYRAHPSLMAVMVTSSILGEKPAGPACLTFAKTVVTRRPNGLGRIGRMSRSRE